MPLFQRFPTSQPSPQARISARTAMNHPFFDDIDKDTDGFLDKEASDGGGADIASGAGINHGATTATD